MSEYMARPRPSAPVRPRADVERQGWIEWTPAAREMAQAVRRRESKAARILERLRQGPATSLDLLAIGGIRYGARIHELRQEGHRITTEDRLDYAVYTLEESSCAVR